VVVSEELLALLLAADPFLTVLQLLFLKFLAHSVAGLTSSGVVVPSVAFFLSSCKKVIIFWYDQLLIFLCLL